MTPERVYAKLKNAIMVSKLITGEEVIWIMMQAIPKHGIACAFPYERTTSAVEIEEGKFTEVPVLEKYGPWVAKRNAYFIDWSDIIFSKEAAPYYADLFLEHIHRTEPEEYARLVADMVEQIRKDDQAKSKKAPADYKTRH